jgi:glutaminyl-tRNA synthetase
LFATPEPAGGEEWRKNLNPRSLQVCHGYVEPSFQGLDVDVRVQLRRVGYFWRDPVDSIDEALVLNRIATLRDSWSSSRPTAPESGSPKPVPKPVAKQEPAKKAALSAVEESLIASAHAAGADVAQVKSLLLNELRRALGGPAAQGVRIQGVEMAGLVALLDAGTINRSAVRPVLEVLLERQGDPSEIIASLGLAQVSDTDALGDAVDGVLAAHPEEVARYRAGEKRLTGFFMGQVMRVLQGKGDPKALSALLREKLS